MTMGSGGDELRLKLHIDTDAVVDDLRAVDAVLRGLEQRMVAAYNRSQRVRKGAVSRAFDYGDIPQGAYRTPEMRQVERHMERRAAELERAAKRGETSAPPTQRQMLQQAAQQRLQQASGKPVDVTVTAKQKFFDDMAASLRRGAPNIVGMAAGQTGIPGASRLAHTLMGLAGDNPLLAGGLGGAVALGAGALAVNAEQARFQRQQASLAGALVGGPAFGDTRTLLGLGVMRAAQQMGASQQEGAGIAQQLAGAGMRPGQLAGNLQNVLTLTHGYGMQSQDVIPIVQALGTAGGLSTAQIATVVRDLVDSTGKATGSLAQLTLGLKAWAAVSSGAARDPASLAAIQRTVGATSGIDAGRLLAPALGATGSQLVAGAAMLGMTPERLAHLQQTPGGAARIFAAEGTFTRQFPGDLTGQQLALQALQERGLIDLSGLKSDQVEKLGALMQRNPNQALSYYRSISAAPKAPLQPHIPEQTGLWNQIRIGLGNTVTQATNQPSPQMPSSAAPTGGAPIPLLFPIGGGKSGLHMVPAGLASAVAAAATGAGRSGDATHTVKIEVTVRDPRGNQLGHRVDTTRVIAGANTTHRPPYDHPGRSSPPPWTGGGTGGHGSGGGSSGFD